MNLAGAAPRVDLVRAAARRGRIDRRRNDLRPDPRPASTGSFWQLCLVVALVALWKGRRLGPLVAERLPVVVRASETVEGRGRLYRSRRARDRAADALRTATLQRLAAPARARAQRRPRRRRRGRRRSACGRDPDCGAAHPVRAPPATDADLVHLAHALDDIERQVAHS